MQSTFPISSVTFASSCTIEFDTQNISFTVIGSLYSGYVNPSKVMIVSSVQRKKHVYMRF